MTRAEAKRAGLTRYFTGKPCLVGHISERLVSNRACVECRKPKVAKSIAKWKKSGAGLASAKKYRESNPDKIAAAVKASNQKNPIPSRLARAKRRAAQLRRTPAWADAGKIKEFYNECPEGMTVDHVIPLQGELVSGLHVHNNLQYLTLAENSSKRNRFDLED